MAVSGLVLALWLRTGWRKSKRAPLGVLIFLACMSQLLLVPGLNFLTCLLISLGIALRGSGWLATRSGRLLRLIRPGIASASVVVLGLAGASLLWERQAQRSCRNRARCAASPVRNVLLIVLDTVRADHLSLYGYVRTTTPNLKKLADAGVRFDQARATASWTLPSHASIFTGRWPHELAVERNGWLDGTFPTLAEYLRRGATRRPGSSRTSSFAAMNRDCRAGFATYRDYQVSATEVVRSSSLGWLLARTALALATLLAGPWGPDPPSASLSTSRAKMPRRSIVNSSTGCAGWARNRFLRS